MSDRNGFFSPKAAHGDEFADDEVVEEEPTQLGGETMSDGKMPVDGDMMSNHDGVTANRRTE